MRLTRERFDTLRAQVARAGVGFALLLGLLGSIITFVPGSQVGWFGVASAAALTGGLSPSKRMRVLAVILGVCLAGLSWDGYLERRRYREYLKHLPEISASSLPPAQGPR